MKKRKLLPLPPSAQTHPLHSEKLVDLALQVIDCLNKISVLNVNQNNLCAAYNNLERAIHNGLSEVIKKFEALERKQQELEKYVASPALKDIDNQYET